MNINLDIDIDNISLRPQYSSWKSTITTTNVETLTQTSVDKTDMWGFYETPYTNPNKEYIETCGNVISSVLDNESHFRVLDDVLPMYKHFLKASEFYRFYLKKSSKHKKNRKYKKNKNKKKNSSSIGQENPTAIITEESDPEGNQFDDEVYDEDDDDSVISEGDDYYSNDEEDEDELVDNNEVELEKAHRPEKFDIV